MKKFDCIPNGVFLNTFLTDHREWLEINCEFQYIVTSQMRLNCFKPGVHISMLNQEFDIQTDTILGVLIIFESSHDLSHFVLKFDE